MLALLTWQALRGQPLIRPDGLTLTALSALLVASSVSVLWALRERTSYEDDDRIRNRHRHESTAP